jgi:hypothetical protein
MLLVVIYKYISDARSHEHQTLRLPTITYYIVHVLVFFSFGWFNRINIHQSFTEFVLRAEIIFTTKQIFIYEIKYFFLCQIVLFVS